MECVKRMSMNTSLKNAKIFDDDAWAENDGKELKKKIKAEPETDSECVSNNIKIEARENDFNNKIKIEPHDSVVNYRIKIEPQDSEVNNKIKIEPQDNDIKNNTFNDTLEEGELRDSLCPKESVREFVCKTPPFPLHSKIKPDSDKEVDAIFDESPYNKELFHTLRIREETPIKTEDEESNSTRNVLKSAKRSVFNRHSPYKRIDNDAVNEKRMSAKNRLGPKLNDMEMPRKKPRPRQDIETDSEVIERREKQIEYGKNTIGYDNYVNHVPREERQPEDPQTPDKFQKYSRRGWDGLIRQWRLKLHKYDPADT